MEGSLNLDYTVAKLSKSIRLLSLYMMNDDLDNAKEIKNDIINNQLPIMQNKVLPFLKRDQISQASENPVIVSGLDDSNNAGINFYMNGYALYKKMETLARFIINLSDEEWYIICFYNNDRNDHNDMKNTDESPQNFHDDSDFSESPDMNDYPDFEETEYPTYDFENNFKNNDYEKQYTSDEESRNFEYYNNINESQMHQLIRNINIYNHQNNTIVDEDIFIHKNRIENINEREEEKDDETAIFGKVNKKNCNFLNDYRIR